MINFLKLVLIFHFDFWLILKKLLYFFMILALKFLRMWKFTDDLKI